MRTKRVLLSLAVASLVGASLGCGTGPPELEKPLIQQPASGATGLPGRNRPGMQNGDLFAEDFFAFGDVTSPVRKTSDETFEVDGAGFVAQSSGSANYVPAGFPLSYALVPGAGQGIAWARYSIADLTADRPVQLDVSVSQARAGEGGELLPLSYFVGVANYTGYHWDWWGPFIEDALVSLNHPASEFEAELNERYVSDAGVLQLVVATGPAIGGGEYAVQVDGATVTTSATYVWNKPHYVWFLEAHAGSSRPKGAKGVTALEPEQFVTLTWNHVEAFGVQDIFNAANSYQISRQAPTDNLPEIVGQAFFPATSFNDPLNREGGVAEPTPGTTYRYSIYAQNPAGRTVPATTSITVPILSPEGLTASLNGEDGGFTLVSWSEVDGAIGYEIWRGVSPVAESSGRVGTVLGGAVDYEDTTATPGAEFWYFIRSFGTGDGDEANGIEAAAISGYSLGAQGLRRVEISIAGIEPVVNGSGTPADPFILSSSSTFQFKAFDQIGRELTFLCVWDTDPEPAATFDGGTPGLLDGIQPSPNEFVARATFSFSTYSWVGSANCSVQ